VPEKSWSIYWG